MNERDRKIINAVVKKAERVCPGSLDLVAVYGSAHTGDTHAKSDLDLLILINDDRGWQLAEGFILDDTQVGYDLYCTTWASLEADAACGHAQISKLTDAQIVYLADAAAKERLEGLREKARGILSSDARYDRVAEQMDDLFIAYAQALLADSLQDARTAAAEVIAASLNAVMLQRGKYFQRGVKRTFDELAEAGVPGAFADKLLEIVKAKDRVGLQKALTDLVRMTKADTARPRQKEQPSPENLSGTYEEMYSNWRNKMAEAAGRGDVFSSFMNMASLQCMLHGIAEEVRIETQDVMERYDPDDLEANTRAFDEVLADYLREYGKAGIQARRYQDVDDFVDHYLA